MRVKGVEPPRLAAPDPKSGASANSATPAYSIYSAEAEDKEDSFREREKILVSHEGLEPSTL